MIEDTAMSSAPTNSNLLALAEEIFGQTYLLVQDLKQRSIKEPSFEPGSDSGIWSTQPKEIQDTKDSIIELTGKLANLLEGPHGFLHELVCSNWELGALYCILEFEILQKIPLHGHATVSELSHESNIQKEKLLFILRLVACSNILEEFSNETFRHTAISELLLTDKDFRAFIGFQYNSLTVDRRKVF